MFACDSNGKIFQTLPGQGWRVLIRWNPAPPDEADGFPAATLEPVIAWVTAKVPREQNTDGAYEEVIIAPLVRWPSGDELLLLDYQALVSKDSEPARKFIYLAPGEELSQQHFEQLSGGYAKGVTLG
jgi:hypothetical protein